jgi:hypothetical protein
MIGFKRATLSHLTLVMNLQTGGTILNIRRILFALMTTLFIMFLSGCAATVGTPPPPHHVEVRPLVPFTGAVWIDGHYIYRHGGYVWEPGRYVKPPYPGSAWTPGYWEKHHRGWRWQKGHWDRKRKDMYRQRDREYDRY